MRLPVRPIENRWPTWLQRLGTRFFWPDPRGLLDAEPDATTFRRLMNSVHVGGTIKITGTDRHPRSDELLLQVPHIEHAVIADIGASDGSTSVDLIAKLPGFSRYTIADLHLSITAAVRRRWVVFFDHTDTCILLANRRIVAWPSLSPWVARVFSGVIKSARRAPRHQVILLNPTARRLIADDPRVDARVHDVFEPWTDGQVDVIKVANLLRRLYFTDDQITAALRTLVDSLVEGGHILLVDNPRLPGIQERGGLYRRQGSHLIRIAETPDRPEIADLVAQLN